jgi:hypothetical protein
MEVVEGPHDMFYGMRETNQELDVDDQLKKEEVWIRHPASIIRPNQRNSAVTACQRENYAYQVVYRTSERGF